MTFLYPPLLKWKELWLGRKHFQWTSWPCQALAVHSLRCGSVGCTVGAPLAMGCVYCSLEWSVFPQGQIASLVFCSFAQWLSPPASSLLPKETAGKTWKNISVCFVMLSCFAGWDHIQTPCKRYKLDLLIQQCAQMAKKAKTSWLAYETVWPEGPGEGLSRYINQCWGCAHECWVPLWEPHH